MNRNYLKYNPGLLISLVMFVSLIVSGCASPNPVVTEVMMPEGVEIMGSSPHSVSVDVYGGPSSHCYNVCLTADAYSEVVNSTLMKSEAFASISNGKDAEYVLDIVIVKSGGVLRNHRAVSTFISRWELTRVEPTRVVWSDIIRTGYSIDLGYSFTPWELVEKANIEAAKVNIKKGIRKLTSFDHGSGLIVHSTYAGIDLDDGLVAYYPFNGNANDKSAYGHDGKVYGAALISDRLGGPDSAFSFDGNNDSIHIKHAETLNFQNSFSVSVWLYVSAWSHMEQRLMGKGTTPHAETSSWHLTLNKNRGVTFFWESPDDADHRVKTENSLEHGKFYHIAAMYDSNLNENRIYVNGDLSDITSAAGSFPGQNRDPLIIGIRNTPSRYDRAFNGTIDDIRIYNRALSEHEIQALYSGDAPAKLSLRKTDQ